MQGVGKLQRALWTFLLFTLVGPFFGALALVVLVPFAALAGLLPGVQGVGLEVFLPLLAEWAFSAYIWGAMPAALAALALMPAVIRGGTFGPLAAAAAGVAAFAAAAAVLDVPDPDLLPYLAFLAGLVAVACRAVLIGSGILLKAAQPVSSAS